MTTTSDKATKKISKPQAHLLNLPPQCTKSLLRIQTRLLNTPHTFPERNTPSLLASSKPGQSPLCPLPLGLAARELLLPLRSAPLDSLQRCPQSLNLSTQRSNFDASIVCTVAAQIENNKT